MKPFYFIIGQFLLTLLFANALETFNANFTDSTWQTSANAPITDWRKVVASSNGQYLAAVSSQAGAQMTGVYLSSNYGKTWNNIFINGCGLGVTWTSIAMDYYGSTIYALQQNLGIYASTNSGTSWTRTIIDPQLTYASYNAVTTSGDGSTVLVTLPYGAIYYSRNFAYSFMKSNAPMEYWWTIATMSTGQYAAALSDYVYYSINYGTSWTKANAPSSSWYDVHLSSNGQFVTAVAGKSNSGSGGGVYLSSNYGLSYALSSGADRSLDWRAVTTDTSGKVIAAVAVPQGIYYSNDYGMTFQQSVNSPTGESWKTITSDANGQYYTLSSQGSTTGHIYYTGI